MDFKKLGFHPVSMVKNFLMAVAAPYIFYHSISDTNYKQKKKISFNDYYSFWVVNKFIVCWERKEQELVDYIQLYDFENKWVVNILKKSILFFIN